MAADPAKCGCNVLGGWVRSDLRATRHRIRSKGEALFIAVKAWRGSSTANLDTVPRSNSHSTGRYSDDCRPGMDRIRGHRDCGRHSLLGTPAGHTKRLEPDQRRIF